MWCSADENWCGGGEEARMKESELSKAGEEEGEPAKRPGSADRAKSEERSALPSRRTMVIVCSS